MADTTFRFEAIGTQWVISIPLELSADASDELLAKVEKRIREYDQIGRAHV